MSADSPLQTLKQAISDNRVTQTTALEHASLPTLREIRNRLQLSFRAKYQPGFIRFLSKIDRGSATPRKIANEFLSAGIPGVVQSVLSEIADVSKALEPCFAHLDGELSKDCKNMLKGRTSRESMNRITVQVKGLRRLWRDMEPKLEVRMGDEAAILHLLEKAWDKTRKNILLVKDFWAFIGYTPRK